MLMKKLSLRNQVEDACTSEGMKIALHLQRKMKV